MGVTSLLTEGLKLIGDIFDHWKLSKRPHKPDRDRYQTVMDNISVPDIYYFREWHDLYHNFPSEHYDGIYNSACVLNTLHAPKFIDKKLNAKEQKLLDALKKMCGLMGRRLYFNPGGRTFTIYRFDYDVTNPEHKQEVIKIRAELDGALDQLIEAFEDFQDYGNEKFAVRLSETQALSMADKETASDEPPVKTE